MIPFFSDVYLPYEEGVAEQACPNFRACLVCCAHQRRLRDQVTDYRVHAVMRGTGRQVTMPPLQAWLLYLNCCKLCCLLSTF